MIGECERQFILAGVADDLRVDGRHRLEFRPVDIEIGNLLNANGSCLLKIHSDTTRVQVAVKLSINNHGDAPNVGAGGGDTEEVVDIYDGRVKCHLEYQTSTMNNTSKLDELRIEISTFLDRILNQSGVIDLKKLTIIPNRIYWTVDVDITILSIGGNILDAVALAVRAALFDTRVPVLAIEDFSQNNQNTANSVVMISNEYSIDDGLKEEPLVELSDIPICVTLFKIGNSKFVVDATLDEEQVSDARLSVAIDRNSKILAINKGFNGGIPSSLFSDMIQTAKQNSLTLLKQQDSFLLYSH